ncbi:MAG: SET domain-containing protein [Candidatus Taylorbacteria bacterium]|nr:SET domain-containing protein [Candidatus Taylorbacteria bacterium]
MKKTFSWVNPKVEVQDTELFGRGVFAIADISKGETVMVMGGYVLGIDEEIEGGEYVAKYNMDISEKHSFCPRTDEELNLMPQNLINHSCEPNVGFKDVVFIISIRDIKKGEQIVYDYAFVMWSSDESVCHFEMDCLCGSRTCRKKVKEDDWNIKSIQEQYGDYFQTFIRSKFQKR